MRDESPETPNGLVTTVKLNHSLNRTHCGMRLKARHFILDF